MSDFHLVDLHGWEYDLQSVYSAYMGYFQLHSIPWHDRTWGQFFETFEQFLGFSWPVITVTDTRTGRAHIVTRITSIAAFLKMIKTRFRETLPEVDNMLIVKPLETSQRHLRHVSDWTTYKKLHAALPAVALAAFKARVKSGDPRAIRELWGSRDKTFLAIDFECLERNERSCIEWGYAAVRCANLEAVGAWPPTPDTNYRKGHYIIAEYADTHNRSSPSVSWQYAFGESQVIPKTNLPRIVQSVLSVVSPDSDTVGNNVVLVGHCLGLHIQRMEEMKIKLPSNVFMIDIALFERALFNTGERGPMADRNTGHARAPNALLGLGGLLHSLGMGNDQAASRWALNNAGNDAFMMLVAFQKMVEQLPSASASGVVPLTRMGMGMGSVTGRALSPVPSPMLLSPFGRGAYLDQAATLPKTRRRGGGEVDELGKMRRASVFSALASPLLLPDDKKRGARDTSGSGSGSTSERQDQRQERGRRGSVIEKRRWAYGHCFRVSDLHRDDHMDDIDNIDTLNDWVSLVGILGLGGVLTVG